MSEDGPQEVLTWAEFGGGCRELAQMVADDGYRPDVILAVARGGLLPGSAVAYALGVKNVFTMNIEFYTGVNRRMEMPVMLPPTLDVVDVTGLTVLVVDDVADTGATLEVVTDYVSEHVTDVRCAVLYEKPQSSVRCDYVWRRTDRWIDFPWSSLDPVVAGGRLPADR
jgi:uncharacterized protein